MLCPLLSRRTPLLLFFALVIARVASQETVLTYECWPDASGKRMVSASCQQQIETPEFLAAYSAAMTKYDAEVTKYNAIASGNVPFPCLHFSRRYCVSKRASETTLAASKVEKAISGLETALLHAARQVNARCPTNETLIARYSNLWNLIEGGAQSFRSSMSVSSWVVTLPWAGPGLVVSVCLCAFALFILIIAIFAHSHLLYPLFTGVVVLSLITSGVRVAWYSLAISKFSTLPMQLLSRVALVTFTILLALFCYAWGSAVAEAISKTGSVAKWKRHLVVGIMSAIVGISALYAIVMAIVVAVMTAPVYDASVLLLPLVQLSVTTTLAVFVFLARREIFRESSSRNRRKEFGRDLRPGDSSRIKAVNYQTLLALIILAMSILHVVIAFISEMTNLLGVVAEFLLRFLLVECVTIGSLLICMFIALRPRKNVHAENYVELSEQDPNVIPPQYEA